MDKAPKGFIKLDRTIFEHWIFQDADKFKAFVDLIQLMRWKDETLILGNEVVVIPRGSYYTSELKLGERWGWSRKKVRAYLNLLEKEGMLNKKGTTKGTTLTLVNYEVYQGEGTTEGTSKEQRRNIKRTTKEHQKNNEGYTKEEVKEGEEIKEVSKNERDELSQNALELCKYYSNLKPGQNITQHMDTLKIWIDMYGMEWTKEVLQMCVSSKGMFIKPWIVKVLTDWKANGKPEPRPREPKQYGKVSTFNDYTQRKYDYDDLERKLLGWDKER